MYLHEFKELRAENRRAKESQEQEATYGRVLCDFNLLGRIPRHDLLLQVVEDMPQFAVTHTKSVSKYATTERLSVVTTYCGQTSVDSKMQLVVCCTRAKRF